MLITVVVLFSGLVLAVLKLDSCVAVVFIFVGCAAATLLSLNQWLERLAADKKTS
jgi:hypothetical protein